jgi:hypothetical protein
VTRAAAVEQLAASIAALRLGHPARVAIDGVDGAGKTTTVEWAFRHSAIHRVSAVCDVDNVASARLLASVGMQLEGTLRRWLIHPNVTDSPRDCYCYAIVKGDVPRSPNG